MCDRRLQCSALSSPSIDLTPGTLNCFCDMSIKCQTNSTDLRSVPLHRSRTSLWTSFSRSSLRRRIIDALRCGGRSRYVLDDNNVEGESSPERSVESGGKERSKCGTDKLSELLMLPDSSEGEAVEEVKRKVEALDEMKRVVKSLQYDSALEGAIGVRRLAKENSEARTTLAMLGAIPPLIALLDSEQVHLQIAALYGLLNLGIGNDANKAAIVKAGAIHKMLNLLESPTDSPPQPDVSEAVIANFLGLSALDANKPIIGSSGAIPHLVTTLKNLNDTCSSQAQQDSLRAIYNLSISPMNVPHILESDLVPYFFSKLGDMDISERILSILCNIVSTPEGRRSISSEPEAFTVLVDVLNWTDSPSCQEKASYILMIMAHKSYGDRKSMIEAGIISSLLELTLLGSTLAQKRASRILECFSIDKGKVVVMENCGGASVSAPICGSSPSLVDQSFQLKEGCLEEGEEEGSSSMMSEERKAVKNLVQQSLQNNMKRIVKRANLHHDFAPSDHFKTLTSSSTSKSLPF